MANPRILVLSGSIRSGSFNNQLAGAAISQLATLECDISRLSLADYPLPLYNGDLEADEGIPENALKLAKQFDWHDGFFITSPEYNGSISPLLKNTIDWISRVSQIDGQNVSPYRGKVAAIAAASPGATGGMSMLFHLRDVLFRLGVLVLSEQVSVGNAAEGFDDMEQLKDERTAQFLQNTCRSLVDKSRAFSR